MTKVWLVDREFDSKGLIRLTYATEDGDRVHVRELAEQQLYNRGGATAAIDVGDDVLESTADEEVDRYRDEAARMVEKHDPDDVV